MPIPLVRTLYYKNKKVTRDINTSANNIAFVSGSVMYFIDNFEQIGNVAIHLERSAIKPA